MAIALPHNQPSAQSVDVLQQEFDALVEGWHEETDYLSSMTAILARPAYQSIIAMGVPAVPLILRELERRPDYWFRALTAITNQNPVPAGSDFEQACQAWLEWGQQGHLK